MRDVISIRTALQQHQLTIDIENLGSSMGGTFETLVSRDVGLSNTIARLRSLYGKDQSFAIRNLSPAGVAVSISIPARLLLQRQPRTKAQAVS